MRAALIIVVCAGCNSILGIPNATAIDGGGTSDGIDAPVDPNLVRGTAIDTNWEATTHVTMPRDLSSWLFSALVANPAAAGGFDIYPGTGKANGTFEVPGVPVGATFTLHVEDPSRIVQPSPSYRTGTERVFDLGLDRLGRPDLVLTTQTSNLVLNVDNMQPYQDTDFFEVFCMNNGGSNFDFTHSVVTNPPAVGDAALVGTTFDWSQPYGPGSPRNPVMNGDLGDTLAVIQESSHTLPSGVTVQTMAALYSEKFNQADGTTYTINASFIPTPGTLTLNPTIMRSQYEAHRAEVNPASRMQIDTDYTYGDSLLPAPDGHGLFGATLDLVVSNIAAGTADAPYGAFSYPDPFPSTWEHLRIFRIAIVVRFSADGGAMAPIKSGFSSNRNLDYDLVNHTTIDDVVQPGVTPVTAATVNTTDAFTGATFSAANPVIVAWTAPAIGTPIHYTVEVIRAYNDTGVTRFAKMGNFITADTQVAIPPSIFAVGSHYVFIVTADTSLDTANDDTAGMISGMWTAN